MARVLLLTAGMGAGHDKVATELRRRLRERGVESEVLDLWDLLPLHIGHLIMGFYKLIIRRAPWLYEAIYAVWLRPGGQSKRASPLIRLAARSLERWIAINQPTAVVSTFHLCSQVLGHLRRRGLMPVETASVVVDFAAHGLWVDPDVDLHLCLHERQAERIMSLGAPRAEAPGPVVGPAFVRSKPSREAARRQLGFAADENVALIVAGSWGTGRLAETVRAVGATASWTPVVVTGRNSALEWRLRSTGYGRVYGWVEDMELFMTAADVVIENAGGLMAMEAMAVGTPVVSFGPIPGHGRENVARMDEVGISRLAKSEEELTQILNRLATDEPYRRRLVATASHIFRADAADTIAAMALRGAATPGPAGEQASA